MSKTVLIKIDVDSVEGMRSGVPFYLETLARFGFSASFFIPFGPNNVVSAGLRRMWRPAFWRQVYYMKPWRTYRLFDADFDKSLEIGKGHPDMVRAIRDAGFEVALHGYDHALISNDAYNMTSEAYAEQLRLARDAYRDILGTDPVGTGAPAWRFNETTARVQDGMNFAYASDMIGDGPCWVKVGDYLSTTVQVPINIDNVFPLVVEFKGDHARTLDYLKRQVSARDDYICMTIHTEYEYVHFRREMTELFRFMAENDMRGQRFDRFVEKLPKTDLPNKDVGYCSYNGAVGDVASTMPIQSLIG